MADFLFVDNRINRSSIQSIIQIGQASELYFQRLHTNCTRVGKAIKRKPHGYGFQPIPTRFFCGGDEGDRTPYLLHAKQALYQVSYTPIWTCLQKERFCEVYYSAPYRFCQHKFLILCRFPNEAWIDSIKGSTGKEVDTYGNSLFI